MTFADGPPSMDFTDSPTSALIPSAVTIQTPAFSIQPQSSIAPPSGRAGMKSNLGYYWYKWLSGHHALVGQGKSLWLRWAWSFLDILFFSYLVSVCHVNVPLLVFKPVFKKVLSLPSFSSSAYVCNCSFTYTPDTFWHYTQNCWDFKSALQCFEKSVLRQPDKEVEKNCQSLSSSLFTFLPS